MIDERFTMPTGNDKSARLELLQRTYNRVQEDQHANYE